MIIIYSHREADFNTVLWISAWIYRDGFSVKSIRSVTETYDSFTLRINTYSLWKKDLTLSFVTCLSFRDFSLQIKNKDPQKNEKQRRFCNRG